MSSTRLRQCSRWCHWLICLVVALGFCLSFVPLPVDQLTVKDLSEPFPCQHRACGCRSAQQCWKTCCCFTNAQKIAWSKTHHIKLPSFVVVAAQLESQRNKTRPGLIANSPAKHCCRKKATSRQLAQQTRSDVSHGSKTRYVLAAFARECQGQGWFWNALPWAIPLEPDATSDRRDEIGEMLEPPAVFLAAIGFRPPVPPPRHVLTSAHS